MAKGSFFCVCVTEKSSLSASGAISVILKTSTLRGSPVFEAAHMDVPRHDNEGRWKSPQIFLTGSRIRSSELEEVLGTR